MSTNPRAAVALARARWEAVGHEGGISVPLFDEAAAEAARDGKGTGPLAGVTAVVKDMVDVAGARCPAGLQFLRDYRPARDASLVRRLREAGALIVGLGASDAAGFGVRTPAVRNPRLPRRTVGGSSGGTAAAIAAGIARVGIGSDTGGSVRIPAACCGIVGFKPTQGVLPVDGFRPLAPTLDHAGILGADIEAVADAFAAVARSRKQQRQQGKLTVGYELDMLAEATPKVSAAFRKVLDGCVRLSFSPIPSPLPGRADCRRVHRDIFVAEAAFQHRGFFADHAAAYPDEAAGAIRLGLDLPARDYLAAMEGMRRLRAATDALFVGIGLLLTPTMPVAAPERNRTAMAFGGRTMSVTGVLIRNTSPFNLTGQPALSLPIPGDGAPGPASVQIVGRRGEDGLVLAFARRLGAAMARG